MRNEEADGRRLIDYVLLVFKAFSSEHDPRNNHQKYWVTLINMQTTLLYNLSEASSRNVSRMYSQHKIK